MDVALRGSLALALMVGATATGVGCGSTAVSELFSGTGVTALDASVVDGSTASDAGAADARADARVRDAGGVDANKPPDPLPLACTPKSGGTCDLLSEVCCWTGTSTAKCQTPQTDCLGVRVPCASEGDCAARGKAGTVCCATFGATTIANDVSCRDPDNCTLSQNRTIVCDPNDSDPCPKGGDCTLSTSSLNGFYICIPN